jgi:PAS domain S-box-containing protein
MSIELSLYSDQRFRALIEHSSDAISLLTPEGTVTYASPSTERVTGYSAEELVGRNGFEFVHSEDLEYTRQQLTALLDRPGHFITFENRFRHADGTWRWAEATLTNLLNDPAVGAVVCNYRDVTERKEGQERLRQSEERYRVLFEQTAVGIFMTDLQGHFVEVNPAGCVLSGYSREELLTKNIEDLVPEEDRASVRAGIERLCAGEIIRSQQRMKRKDGSLLPIGTTANPLSTGHLLATVRDISDHIQAGEERARLLASEQAARAEAEARAAELSATFEAMTEGVSVCDARGEIRYTNAAYRSLLALEEDFDPSLLQLDKRIEWLATRDLEGRPLPKEQHPLLRVLRGERLSGAHTLDLLCRTRRGEDIILNVSGAPIRDAAGQIVGGVVAFRDITRQHTLEQQLQSSERKLRSLVESNILGVVVADVDGKIYEINERAAQIVGYSRDELLSETFNWLQVVPLDAQEAQAQSTQTLLSTGNLPPFEGEYLRKDGSRLPVVAAGTMIDQKRRLALGVVLDISDRRAAERRKQEFLSMVSHELRTPLTSIMGMIELALMQLELRPRSLPSEAEGLLKQIEKLLKRADGQVEIEARLVEELLDVSRLEMHKFEMSVHPENLVTIVQETVANQQQAARTRHIELVLPQDEGVPVIVDAGRVGQVLTNYLINAFKYAPVDQVVSVRLEVVESSARVSVRDQGPGLTPEEQQHVWEHFYQTEPSMYRGTGGGLGLGLAIAKAIVEQHQGQVGVESAPGRGSTFWFTLPLAGGLIKER